ncbi:MAG: flagellar basal body-associated protein FliL [Rhodospirillales bacterium]|nr:flagellar basal body-associated protein FliL [Rhodospirillales bacterium]
MSEPKPDPKTPPKGAEAAKADAAAKDPKVEAAPDDDGAPPVGGKAKLILAAAGLAVVLAIGGVAYYLISGSQTPPSGETAKAPQKSAAVEFGPVVFHDYPEQLVDLKTGACKSAFLKYQLTVEIPEKDRQRLVDVQARIFDRPQMYLRNQERQDLVGKAGAEKLREELTTIVNGAISPARANSVLFKKFLLQ